MVDWALESTQWIIYLFTLKNPSMSARISLEQGFPAEFPKPRLQHSRVPTSQTSLTRASQSSHKPDQGIPGFPQAIPGHPRVPTSQTRASQGSHKPDQGIPEFP